MPPTGTPSPQGFFARLKRWIVRWTIFTIAAIVAMYLVYMFLFAPRRQGLAESGYVSLDIAIPRGQHFVNASWQQGGKLWYTYCPDNATPPVVCTFTEYTPPGVIAGKFTFTQTR